MTGTWPLPDTRSGRAAGKPICARINNTWHPWKPRRQPAASPLTRITPKMSARSNAKKEVGSNRPKRRRQAADRTAEKLCRDMRICFSDRINNKWHPRKPKRHPAASPLTWITPKMSTRSKAKKEVGSNRPKPRRQAADRTAEKLCWGKMKKTPVYNSK
ncbi:hypothetical protein NDU88_006710 [Pleurodeles waltl]|uniref:Uncharacterized protein n=1 Tax=Pleurodeles waltl TaxID=8319 RepID=A0AAV7QJU2_PLEWA|nr:hypothetical protein NDU88_006710 [Pleurodeles waltl]